MPPRPVKQSPSPRFGLSSSVLDRIGDIGFGDDDGLKMLVYGESGTGKTTFAGSFPGPILWIVCSGGNNPGELRSLDTPEHRKKIKQVALQKSSEMTDIIPYIRETGIATTVLDHASGYADLVLKELLGIDELPAQKGWGLASQQQYGQMAQQCKEAFRSLLNLPGHVIIVAQQRTFGGSEDGTSSDILKPTVGAGLTPSLTGWLNSGVDYLVQTFKRPKMETSSVRVGTKDVITTKRGKGIEYCLRTEPHETFQTKFRIPKGRPLPECIVDPSYDKLMKLIKG